MLSLLLNKLPWFNLCSAYLAVWVTPCVTAPMVPAALGSVQARGAHLTHCGWGWSAGRRRASGWKEMSTLVTPTLQSGCRDCTKPCRQRIGIICIEGRKHTLRKTYNQVFILPIKHYNFTFKYTFSFFSFFILLFITHFNGHWGSPFLSPFPSTLTSPPVLQWCLLGTCTSPSCCP